MKIQLRVAFVAIAYLIFAQALAAEQIVVYQSENQQSGDPVLDQ
jgi:hypothetical protein